ncbi:MAG: DUF166 domain-containing protein [Proteobacteria bacterium]|nr:DUF166 domain-containing protein [Pseudomonadota bacterium]
MDSTPMNQPTRIVVFQEKGSGREKMKGIQEFGKNIEIIDVISIDAILPDFIESPEEYITDDFEGDLVLCYLKHPDLADYLVRVCNNKNIPVIAAGKKIKGAQCPFTCCGLGRIKGLGAYGDQFGFPEYQIKINNGKIAEIKAKRGASCGATWDVTSRIIGLAPEEALTTLPREVQYLCTADPSAFDPISGKSSVHYAGDVHHQALKKALKFSREQE